MGVLQDVLKHLEALESGDPKHISPWTPEQKDAAEQEQMSDKDGDIVILVNAYIAYSGACGFASSGSQAYAVNRLGNANVNATVRVHWQQGINNGQYDTVVYIPAGSRTFVGCTRGAGVGGGSYQFSVVGSVP